MERLISDTRAYFERFSPLVFAIVGFLLSYFFLKTDELIQFISQSESSVLSVSITLGGFLLTIYTIINSIENRITRALKQEGSFELLVKYLNMALKSNFILVFLVFVVILFRSTDLTLQDISSNFFKALCCIYVSYFLLTIFRSFRIIYLMSRLLGYKK